MITITEVLLILIIHYISDFIFQDEKWAVNKWKSFNDLISHTSVYSAVNFVLMIPVIFIYRFTIDLDLMMVNIILFSFVSFIFHTITDFVMSKIVHNRFENKHLGSSIPNTGAFSMIGLDQVLHYIQLFIIYKMIFL